MRLVVGSGFPRRFAAFIVPRRRLAFWVAIAVGLAMFAGIARLVVENNYRSFIGPDSQALQVSDWLSDRQGQGREAAILLYRPGDGDAFSSTSLLQYLHIADRAKSLPHVSSTKSWLDVEKIVEFKPASSGGQVDRRAVPLMAGVDAFTDDGRLTLKSDLLALPIVGGRFIARDGSSAAVVLSLDFADGDGRLRRERVSQLKAAIGVLEAELKGVNPQDRLTVTGSSLFDYSANQVLRQDLRRLFPLGVAFVIIVLLIIYRSPRFVALFMVMVLVPVLATAGLTAAVGLPFSNLAISSLLLVGTLAVADVMHLANSYFLRIGEGEGTEDALRNSIQKNFWAVSATTATTMVGQASLLLSPAEPIRVMAIIDLFGSLLALVFALVALPFVLQISGRPQPATLQSLSRSTSALSGFCYRNASGVAAVFVVLVLAAAFIVPKARIDDSLQGWFSKETEFHQDLAHLQSLYLGGNTITMAMEARQEDLLAARRYPAESTELKLHVDLMRGLEAVASGGHWSTLVNTAEAAGRRMAGDSDSGLRGDSLADPTLMATLKPASADTAARAGLMTRYEPGKSDYSLWLHGPAAVSSFELVDTAARLESTMKKSADDRDVRVGGIGLAIAQLSISNLQSMLTGSLLTLAIICASMIAVFRSVRLGTLSMIPNLAPVLIAFGIWVLWRGQVNLAAITVFAVALGIVVDDTIHLGLKYQVLRAEGLDGDTAIRESAREGGVGVLATSLILAGGFAILGQSDFLLTAEKAQLAALVIGTAVLFDLTMMPALLALAERAKVSVAARVVSQGETP